MPWKHNHKILQPGKAWRDTDGTLHSALWMRYPDADKTKYNIVWENPPASEAPYDKRFYNGRNEDGDLIPKSLTELKTTWVENTKRMANQKLSAHDWYVVRNAEKSTAIPSSVTTYRDAVRTMCAEIETALNAAADLTAFMALFEDTRDGDNNITAVAKINDWPDEI